MAKNDLILHKEHGVNPTIPICSFCGEDKNDIVLSVDTISPVECRYTFDLNQEFSRIPTRNSFSSNK